MNKVNGTSNRVQHYAKRQTALDILDALTHPQLLENLKAQLPPHRAWLSPLTKTLSMFIGHVLSTDGVCRNAADQAAGCASSITPR